MRPASRVATVWRVFQPTTIRTGDRKKSSISYRAQHRGHEYVERKLVTFGARAPESGQDMRAWLAEALIPVSIRPLAHGGNHRYGFALGTPAERRAIRADLGRRGLPYPKLAGRMA
jgi:hypothetical protein